jgi:hypothetical protein
MENPGTPDKGRNFFQEFILSLNSVDGLGQTHLVVPNKNEDYVDALIRGYGLLRDGYAREMLIEILDNMEDIDYRYLRVVDKQYLAILLWDIFIHSDPKQIMAILWKCLWVGVLFGEMVEWEDIDEDPPK